MFFFSLSLSFVCLQNQDISFSVFNVFSFFNTMTISLFWIYILQSTYRHAIVSLVWRGLFTTYEVEEDEEAWRRSLEKHRGRPVSRDYPGISALPSLIIKPVLPLIIHGRMYLSITKDLRMPVTFFCLIVNFHSPWFFFFFFGFQFFHIYRRFVLSCIWCSKIFFL